MIWPIVIGGTVAVCYVLATYIRIEGLQMDLRRLRERMSSLKHAVGGMREDIQAICDSISGDIGYSKPFEAVDAVKVNELLTTAFVVDVRDAREFEAGHLPSANNIELSLLEGEVQTLDKDRTTLVYCQKGLRSEKACELLGRAGFTSLYMLDGGLDRWDGKLVSGAAG